ncbi:MAG: hypothetical protein LV468_03015 [Candidatus Nitrosotenuis sp.]|nr:hypothetical protein [Candidatus Nitrosotenuis sp.]
MQRHLDETNTVNDRIIRQRIESLTRYLDDPYALNEKLDELKYFVQRKMQG